MSYRERLDRMAAEKAAADKERQEKAQKRKAEAASRPARKRSSSASSAIEAVGRTRIVWAVCNQMGDTVQTFAYPEKDAAEALAQSLSDEKGARHYVSKQKVAMD